MCLCLPLDSFCHKERRYFIFGKLNRYFSETWLLDFVFFVESFSPPPIYGQRRSQRGWGGGGWAPAVGALPQTPLGFGPRNPLRFRPKPPNWVGSWAQPQRDLWPTLNRQPPPPWLRHWWGFIPDLYRLSYSYLLSSYALSVYVYCLFMYVSA